MKQEEKIQLIEFINEMRSKSTEEEKNNNLQLFYLSIKKELEWYEIYYKKELKNKENDTTLDKIYKAKLQLTTDLLDYLEFYYRQYKNE